MALDLSLPSRAPELDQCFDCNWDDAAFAVYTLIRDKVPLQDVASTLEKQWLENGMGSHLVQPAPVAPDTELRTLQDVVQAHIALDKGKQKCPGANTRYAMKWWPTAFIVVVQEDWRTNPGGLLFVYANDEEDFKMDKFFFKVEDAYRLLSSLSFGDEMDLDWCREIYSQELQP